MNEPQIRAGSPPRCRICPRRCGAVRGEHSPSSPGVCRMGQLPVVARAALHFWEEPCISGTRGSGTVFFSGCPLNCVFCQNSEISREGFGREISVSRLREIYDALIAAGAHNINLVTPTHFVESILLSLEDGLPVPAVYNCGGYESIDTLRLLEGRIQVYLPDMKYSLRAPALRYSTAPDYVETAKAAIKEMYRQTGSYRLDGDGLLQSGVLIRHLILPGNLGNTFGVIDWVAETFPRGSVLFSLMSQYTPHGDLSAFPELQRRLSRQEYDEAEAYLFSSGIEDGFMQELSSATEEYIPPFNLEGVLSD